MKFNIVKDYVFGVGFPVGLVDSQTGDLFSAIDRTSAVKFRSKQFRRSHVQLFVFNLMVVAGFGLFGTTHQSNILFICFSLALLLTSSLVRYSILGIADLPSGKLDERERILRGDTFVQAYKYLGFSAIYFLFASVLWGGVITHHNMIVVTILFTASSITLPSAIIAWKQAEI